jgi:predicted RNA-binding protein with RPS1 domain
VGDLVTGKVAKLASFGAFIGLENEIDGLVHISQISEDRVEKIKNVLTVGQEVTARVVKIDRGERRIGLSIKAANYTPSSSRKSRRSSTPSSPAKISWRLWGQRPLGSLVEIAQDVALTGATGTGTGLPQRFQRNIAFEPILPSNRQLRSNDLQVRGTHVSWSASTRPGLAASPI